MKEAYMPAFPVTSVLNDNGEMTWGSDGLTKREYYAGLAMQALISRPEKELMSKYEVAQLSRYYADALLEGIAQERK